MFQMSVWANPNRSTLSGHIHERHSSNTSTSNDGYKLMTGCDKSKIGPSAVSWEPDAVLKCLFHGRYNTLSFTVVTSWVAASVQEWKPSGHGHICQKQLILAWITSWRAMQWSLLTQAVVANSREASYMRPHVRSLGLSSKQADGVFTSCNVQIDEGIVYDHWDVAMDIQA